MTVGNEPSNQMNHKIGGTTMTRMLDLRNILELVDNGFDNRSFAQQELIRQMHELVFHVFAQPSDELESLFKEQSSQGSRDIAAIPKQLAPQTSDHLGNRLTVINIAGSQTTGQQIAAVVDSQVQFKAVKPAHGSLTTPGISCKDPMVTDPLGITDFQGGGIDKTDPGTGSKSALQVGQERNQHPWNESDKASIT